MPSLNGIDKNGHMDPEMLDRDGRPMIGADGNLVPHVRTFAAVINSVSRVYSYRFDEALRDSTYDAVSMRRDIYLRSLLQERQAPTIVLPWNLEVDNEKDPRQKEVMDGLKTVLKRTPRMHQLRQNCLEALWYGRYGINMKWDRQEGSGKIGCVGHFPVNGDKIQYRFDGTPCVAVNYQLPIAGLEEGIKLASGGVLYTSTSRKQTMDWQWNQQGRWQSGIGVDGTVTTDRGYKALVLDKPEWRQRFIIHRHLADDGDYFDAESAGGIYGVGLRSIVYWGNWLRTEVLSWMLGFMESTGMMDLYVFNYATGNAEGKLQAEANAAKITGKIAIAMPRDPKEKFEAVEQIPANSSGIEALHKLVNDYFDKHIERMFVGQSMSSGADTDGSLGGSGKAQLSQDTKGYLLEWDAASLDETLTTDLVEVAKKLNYPWADFPVRMKSSVGDPRATEKLQSGKTLVDMGAAVIKSELYKTAGYTVPAPTDEVIGGMQPGGMPGGPGSPPGGDQVPGMGPIGPDGKPAGGPQVPGLGALDQNGKPQGGADGEESGNGGGVGGDLHSVGVDPGLGGTVRPGSTGRGVPTEGSGAAVRPMDGGGDQGGQGTGGQDGTAGDRDNREADGSADNDPAEDIAGMPELWAAMVKAASEQDWEAVESLMHIGQDPIELAELIGENEREDYALGTNFLGSDIAGKKTGKKNTYWQEQKERQARGGSRFTPGIATPSGLTPVPGAEPINSEGKPEPKAPDKPVAAATISPTSAPARHSSPPPPPPAPKAGGNSWISDGMSRSGKTRAKNTSTGRRLYGEAAERALAGNQQKAPEATGTRKTAAPVETPQKPINDPMKGRYNPKTDPANKGKPEIALKSPSGMFLDAMRQPSSIRSQDLPLLAKYLRSMPEDQLRGYARELDLKKDVTGLKREVVARLLEHVQGKQGLGAESVQGWKDSKGKDVAVTPAQDKVLNAFVEHKDAGSAKELAGRLGMPMDGKDGLILALIDLEDKGLISRKGEGQFTIRGKNQGEPSASVADGQRDDRGTVAPAGETNGPEVPGLGKLNSEGKPEGQKDEPIESEKATEVPQEEPRTGENREAATEGLSKEKPAAKEKPKPEAVRNIPLSELHLDPERFQFKTNTKGPYGVTDKYKSVTEWEPDFIGTLLAWKDPADGKTYIVNGHHRYEMAKRFGVDDLPIKMIDAKDATEARARGALANIADDKGTPLDAAKFMRDTGCTVEDFKKRGVNLESEGLARKAETLTKLSDKAFQSLTRGDLDEAKALAVAKHLHDPERQDKLFKRIEGKKLSGPVIEEMAQTMASVPTHTKIEKVLWGDEETTEDTFDQRAELSAAIKADLAKETNDWQAVASERRKGRVEGEGNVLNTEKNSEKAKESASNAETFAQHKNKVGAISEALDAASVKLAAAKTDKERADVRREATEAVRTAIEQQDAKFRKPKVDGGTEGSPVRGGEGGHGGKETVPGPANGESKTAEGSGLTGPVVPGLEQTLNAEGKPEPKKEPSSTAGGNQPSPVASGAIGNASQHPAGGTGEKPTKASKAADFIAKQKAKKGATVGPKVPGLEQHLDENGVPINEGHDGLGSTGGPPTPENGEQVPRTGEKEQVGSGKAGVSGDGGGNESGNTGDERHNPRPTEVNPETENLEHNRGGKSTIDVYREKEKANKKAAEETEKQAKRDKMLDPEKVKARMQAELDSRTKGDDSLHEDMPTLKEWLASGQTEGEYLKAIRGKSKATVPGMGPIDNEGHLLWHGNHDEKPIFDPDKTMSGGGFWFGTSADNVKPFGIAKPYKVNIKNPATMQQFHEASKQVAKEMNTADMSDEEYSNPENVGKRNRAVVELLKSKGFDGLHTTNHGGAGGKEVWAAFDPHQIKPHSEEVEEERSAERSIVPGLEDLGPLDENGRHVKE